MESTGEFVQKVHENQDKARRNKKSGKGTPGDKLQSKQHATNK